MSEEIRSYKELEQVSKLFYGHENKQIVDKLDLYKESEKAFESNLSYFETIIKEPLEKTIYKIKFQLDLTNLNSSYHKFAKNVRIHIPINPENFWVDIEMGGSRIDRYYSFMFNILNKKYNIKNYENCIVIPWKYVPLPGYHNVDVTIYIDDPHYRTIQEQRPWKLEYDLFLYNIKEDSLNIVDKTDTYKFHIEYPKNFEDDFTRFMNYTFVIDQFQFIGDTPVTPNAPTKIRVNLYHVVTAMVINVSKEHEDSVCLVVNGTKCKLQLND